MTAQNQIAQPAAVIADAWDTVKERPNLDQQDIDRIVRKVAQETADLAGRTLSENFGTVDLGKGFSIIHQPHMTTPESTLTQGFVIVKTSETRDHTAVIGAAPGTSKTAPALRDTQVPQTLTHWEPELGDPEQWLITELRNNVAEFIRQNA